MTSETDTGRLWARRAAAAVIVAWVVGAAVFIAVSHHQQTSWPSVRVEFGGSNTGARIILQDANGVGDDYYTAVTPYDRTTKLPVGGYVSITAAGARSWCVVMVNGKIAEQKRDPGACSLRVP